MAKIFDKENVALMSFGKAMSRMAAQPIDESEVWYDLAALTEYAKNGETAYVGMKVTYVDEENSKVYQYSIQTDGTLKEIGVAPIGDDASITVTAEGLVSIFGFTGADNGTLPVRENGKLVWKTLEAIGAGDGNDNTTYEISPLQKGEGDSVETYGIVIKTYFNGQPAVDEDGNEIPAVEIPFDVYTKSETQAYIAQEIEKKIHIERKIVTSVDLENNTVVLDGATEETAAIENVVYMLKVEGVEGDSYKEYMLIDSALVQIGDTSTDLSDYAKSADVEEAYAKKATTLAGYGIEDAYTKTEVYTKTQTDTAIEEAVKNATGGESASAVLTELTNYKKAVNTELWGSETVEDYTTTKSRIDTIQEANSLQDTAITAAQAQADKGVADAAAAAQAVSALESGKVTENATAIEQLKTKIDATNTNVTAVTEQVAAVETDISTNIKPQIKSLIAKDETIEQSIATNTAAITNLQTKDNEFAALISTNTDAIANRYTKSEVDALLTNLDQSELEQGIADNTAAIEAEVTRAQAAEKANADAITALTEGQVKTNTDAIAALDATLKAAIENEGEGLDSIKELATWVEEHGSDAAEMSAAITANEQAIAAINHETTGILAQAKAYTNDAINGLPAATADKLGLVKASTEVTVATDGTLGIGEVSTDKLVQGTMTFVLSGGTSANL